MLRTLTHLRDFLTEEELKFLPGRLQTGTFMVLTQHTKKPHTYVVDGVEKTSEVHHTILQVFDKTGTWIGTIVNPDWIPNEK